MPNNHELSVRGLLQPIQVGLTVSALIEELDEVFPEESPSLLESKRNLMWRGGERNVVKWIKNRIQTDSEYG